MSKINEGDLVINPKGLRPEVIYECILQQENGLMLCQDIVTGDRFSFNASSLEHATEDQIANYTRIDPREYNAEG
jgi:hypothetical protein